MVNEKASELPTGQEPIIHGSTLGSAAPHIAIAKADGSDFLETVVTNQTDVPKEVLRQNLVASLGITDWEAKEKKIVRTLDMTLLPQLWILYLNNFLNRTNIA